MYIEKYQMSMHILNLLKNDQYDIKDTIRNGSAIELSTFHCFPQRELFKLL